MTSSTAATPEKAAEAGVDGIIAVAPAPGDMRA